MALVVSEDFAYVMVETAALRLDYALENSTDFADRIESILRRAMKISLDETVEDESNDDKNIIDNDMDSKRTTTEMDYDGKDQ